MNERKMKPAEIITGLKSAKCRSAWDKGVQAYAMGMVTELDAGTEYTASTIETALLNGAQDWPEYAYGGSGLIYDCDIAVALCTPSELKKTRNGERNPNSRESWLDVEARARKQACNRIKHIMR